MLYIYYVKTMHILLEQKKLKIGISIHYKSMVVSEIYNLRNAHNLMKWWILGF